MKSEFWAVYRIQPRTAQERQPLVTFPPNGPNYWLCQNAKIALERQTGLRLYVDLGGY